MVGGATVGGILTWVGVAINPHPVDRDTAIRLAEAHNQHLRDSLGVEESESVSQSSESVSGPTLTPMVGNGQYGLGLGMSF